MPGRTAAEPDTGARTLPGKEIRRWRTTRGLTLAAVSGASGLNLGYLSQIETGKAVPSIDALLSIAEALDVPPAWLFLDSAPAPRVVRASERPRVGSMPLGDATEVDGGTARDLRIIEAVVSPGESTGIHMHTGDEHHVILSGRWRMTHGERVIEAGPGDYVAWDPTVPHDVANIGDEPARILVIYPRQRRSGE